MVYSILEWIKNFVQAETEIDGQGDTLTGRKQQENKLYK